MENKNYSIGVLTYFRRFDDWLKPLIIEIKRQRPNIEIVISINGEVNEDFHEDYRKNVLLFLSEYTKTFPVFYPRFRSMSKMWNTNATLCTQENCLLLEDDIVLEDGFFDEYEKQLDGRLNSNMHSFIINGSYSAFSVNKREMIKVGWFDERFLGLGHEDGEFTNRYNRIMKYNSNSFNSISINSCKNVEGFEKLDQLIKQEVRISGQRPSNNFNGRYSKFNDEIRDYIYENPNQAIQYPYEEFYLDNKNLL